MISRRRCLSLCAIGAAVTAGYPILIEPTWLEITFTTIHLPGLAATKPVRVLHLADLHASVFVPQWMIDHAIQVGLKAEPDMVCLTGDFITHQRDFNSEGYINSLSKLSQTAPTYAVLGNHDGGKWAPARGGFADHKVVEAMLHSSGVKLLHNQSETIRVHGHDLHLVGVGDLWSEEVDAASAFARTHGNLTTLLLSHNPDSKDALAAFPWSLMLSGHTHGGQVIIPFEGPRYAPVKDKRYVAGLKSWGDRQIYVTRGVGNVGGVRFRCRPEVSILSLV